ncbi:hypothetical protein HY385_01920 [Candidatus Daviesbacteria bacterium]|nr:hypothetical protein [Candidatus Daviesbacteria bacterium]
MEAVRILDLQEVAVAARGDNIHPMAGVLNRYAEEFKDNSKDLPYKRIAEDIAQLEPYSLEALDIISIWRYVDPYLPDPNERRYTLARLILADYGVRGLEHPGWKDFPELFYRNKSLPGRLKADHTDIARFEEKMQGVLENVENIERFCRQLPNKPRSRRLRPILERTVENFRGGLVPFRYLSSYST